MSAIPGGLGLHLGPSLCRKRARTSFTKTNTLLLGPSILRQGSRSDVKCNTLEQEGALELVNFDLNGFPKPRSPATDTNETFQQLRQAVLSSLDFSDNTSDQGGSDWDDVHYDSSLEDVTLEHPTAAAVGRAVYETLRIDPAGKARRVYIRRRDLIRAYGLQPRDLRRVDPSLGVTKTSPSVTIKDMCILVNIGGVRSVIAADKCLLFEPNSPSSRKFVELVTPRLQANAAERARQSSMRQGMSGQNGESDSYTSDDMPYPANERVFPMELEMLEGAFMVATGKLEGELVGATRRVSSMLQKLPKEITPVNLEELRRIKQLLVELESKSENLRDLLEEMMDDEDEIRELNLSSRPKREEKRRQRERDRLEREAERGSAAAVANRSMDSIYFTPSSSTEADTRNGGKQNSLKKFANNKNNGPSGAGAGVASGNGPDADAFKFYSPGFPISGDDMSLEKEGQEAQDALEEMLEEEEEERELEEVEDLLEYYLQRAATTQSEAERLLAGARDLEESIAVSLSAKRFEVNRLELLLSIASFAAALGAMVASIFGMNLRSTLEMSVIGFWGTTVAIVAGSCWIFWVLFKYTKRKRIL